jgi:hypothetical protein
MNKYISHSWFAGGVKEFDTVTGQISNAPDMKWDETGFGSVWKQNGKWFAFHKDEQSLILQHKNHVWRLEPNTTVSLQGLFFRKFIIKENGKIVFKIRYKPKGLLKSIIDPTYDSIDMESDDFFLYISNMWKSWGSKPFSEFKNEFAGEKL